MLESDGNSEKKTRNMVVSGLNPEDADDMQQMMHQEDDDFMNK